MTNSISLIFKIVFCLVCLGSFTSTNAQEKNPKVIAIYPTTDSIPVNILRFYIQFSKPMQEMNVLNHIVLLDENNKNITGVFYENQYELWNEDRTKITLIVDPGRVKLGLLANNKMGKAFDEGKKYSLKVDGLLLDFDNQPLANPFTKSFIAVKEDTTAPDTKKWKLSLPNANTTNPIIIDFNDNIDHISAMTYIKIVRDKNEIEGNFTLQNNEQKANFNPNKKWQKGNYQILVHPRLEDITANSVNQVFDHNTAEFKKNNDQNFFIKFTIK
jgi:hypothetical protein